MKAFYKITIGFALVATLATSCNKVLEESPKNIYTPGFFKTPAGVEGGLTALYSSLRDQFGNGYAYSALTTGTEEATYGQSADGGFKASDLSGAASFDPSNSSTGNYWRFTYINTANGIIENASEVGLSPALIAEARFFRAFEYYNIVRQFGGVPLDLGSGELKFNTSSVRTSVRNTVPEVYTKCIFPDLKAGVADLPEAGRKSGSLTKTAARIVLAQAYLTYGWWLENPGDIPTYPECPRTDPDGKTAQQYYQMAYDLATEGINNPGPFGLQPTYYSVFAGQYDYNKEHVLYADHTEQSAQYNGGQVTGMGIGGSPANFASWMIQWNYPNMKAKADTGVDINPVLRTDQQALGRPWTRMATTKEALEYFTDRAHDSRYDGTFTAIYRTNWDRGGTDANYIEGPNGAQIGINEPFLEFLPEEDATVEYTADLSQIVAGVSPKYNHYVITPSGISRLTYPGLWKIGPYRTNTTGIGEPNVDSTRPFVILKFSNLYLIAAEAAFKLGNNTDARNALLVLRRRAGMWEYKQNEDVPFVADFSQEMEDATPATITLNYILDESLRENFGEGFRWFELARTQTWKERAGTYTIAGNDKSDHNQVVTTRTIEKYHYLRPIPKGQIDAMMMTDEEKAAYQNPGYITN